MIRIGAVDIDTSHPKCFGEILRKGDLAAYTCVYNKGFRSSEYVQQFMKENNITIRHDHLKKMAAEIDIAFIHSCNWNKHLDLAMPFLDAGKPVFIDKPIVGNLRDCVKLETLAAKGAKIMGGSAVRYCREFTEFLAKPIEERGEIIALFGSNGVDEFNYGIHVIEALSALAQSPAHSVQCITNDRVEIYRVKFKNGITGVYQLCTGIWRPISIVVTTTKGTFQMEPKGEILYSYLLERIFNHLSGGTPMADVASLTDCTRIALAGRYSREHGNIEVKPEDLCIDASGYDGDSFEAYYARICS